MLAVRRHGEHKIVLTEQMTLVPASEALLPETSKAFDTVVATFTSKLGELPLCLRSHGMPQRPRTMRLSAGWCPGLLPVSFEEILTA